MNKSKKAQTIKASSVLINFIEGAFSVPAFAVIYSFIFEADNQDLDVGLGLFILFVCVLFLFAPNIIFMFIGKFNIKDRAVF